MRNVTITLKEETARWAKIWAARQGSSVSRLLGGILEEMMLRERGYEAARRRFMRRPARPLKAREARYPDRESIHDRP